MVLVTVIPTLRLNGASPMMVGMSLGSCPISPLREYFVWTVTLFSKWYRRLGIISDDFIFDLSHQFSRPKYQDKAVSQYLSALPNGTYAGLFNPYVIFYLTILTERQIRLFITGEEECVRYPSDKSEYLPAPTFNRDTLMSQHNPTDTVSGWVESLFWSVELLPPLPLSLPSWMMLFYLKVFALSDFWIP